MVVKADDTKGLSGAKAHIVLVQFRRD